ncbi:hypothetical protein [Mastigocladopsis repens]|nr:hypothetical protein [Mastigocladopsis repens]
MLSNISPTVSGYWNKGWDEPDSDQHHRGAGSFEPLCIEKARL